jgi:hypothetical protein
VLVHDRLEDLQPRMMHLKATAMLHVRCIGLARDRAERPAKGPGGDVPVRNERVDETDHAPHGQRAVFDRDEDSREDMIGMIGMIRRHGSAAATATAAVHVEKNVL